MDASLDTNAIIHLYNAGLQSMLFSRFEKIKVYEFIRIQELERHADPKILNNFDNDIEAKKIELITDVFLKEIGMHNIFQTHVKEIRILYNSGDLGEVYAISLAKTLGCISLVTDDIKEYGPHYTLMRTEDSEVMPFAFYELLLLDYLESKLSREEYKERFDRINSLSDLKWNYSSTLKKFLRRFWNSPYCESEREWMRVFCEEHQINAKSRLQELQSFLENGLNT